VNPAAAHAQAVLATGAGRLDVADRVQVSATVSGDRSHSATVPSRSEFIGAPTTKYEQLVAEGRITKARRPREPAPTPVVANGTVSDLIAEQRR
jgi:hypothetical protein